MEKNIHFIGIKGSGMSSLAQILHDLGHKVQGSDIEKFLFTQVGLDKRGIKLMPFFHGNIKEDQLVIIGNAFKDDHEEVKRAKEMGVEHYRYHEFLSKLMNQYTSIGVSGAHGKTSTTSLLSHVLNQYRPTSYLIGDGTGVGKKESDYFAFEACEYRRHFLAYHPDYAIITNIDFDHPDYFSGLEDVVNAFEGFASQAKKGIIICGDDSNSKRMISDKPVYTYGIGNENDIHAENIDINPQFTEFDVYHKNEKVERIRINQHGTHAIQNALAVSTVCIVENIPLKAVKNAFETFEGAKRRFNIENIGETVVVDDYAHHPTEIKATIEAARQKYPNKEIVAVFQPHTFSRTAKFLNEFKEALSLADLAYGCPIFGSARELQGNLTIHDLTDHVITLDTIKELNQHKGQVLLFMGAGDITKYIEAYKKQAI